MTVASSILNYTLLLIYFILCKRLICEVYTPFYTVRMRNINPAYAISAGILVSICMFRIYPFARLVDKPLSRNSQIGKIVPSLCKAF